MNGFDITFFQHRASACRNVAEWLGQGVPSEMHGDSRLHRQLSPRLQSLGIRQPVLPDLRLLVVGGLDCLARNARIFDETVNIPTPFTEHFSRTIEAAENENKRPKRHLEDPGAVAFDLLEDMATFFRERTLKQGCTPLESAEKDVLECFETSGEWFPADGTMVSDWYYVQIPARVFQYLLKQVSSPPAQTHRV